jgi:hypothetical protein
MYAGRERARQRWLEGDRTASRAHRAGTGGPGVRRVCLLYGQRAGLRRPLSANGP